MAQLKDLIVTGATRVLGDLYANSIVGDVDGTAEKASKDGANNVINSTYLKDISLNSSGQLIGTKGDNTTTTPITVSGSVDPATDSVAGKMKLYTATGQNTDGTMTQKATTDAIGAVPYISGITQDQTDGHILTISTNNGTNTPSTTTITTVDTTYTTGTGSTAGLTKLYTGTGNNTDGTMTQAAITTALGNIISFNVTVVSELPTTDIQTNTIYLVPNGESSGQNVKDEYMYINNNWEIIGSTYIDLTDYVDSTALGTALGLLDYVDSITQSGSTVTIGKNVSADTTINVGVTSISAGNGLETSITNNGDITSTGSIGLPTQSDVTAGSYGPSADVTGSNTNTINVPKITVDQYGRVTALTSYNLTCQDHTYTPQSLGFGYGTCSTATSTAAKAVTLSGYNKVTNGIVAVKFNNEVGAGATLNINSQGASPIFFKGLAITSGVINSGATATFVYNGTNYVLLCTDDMTETACAAGPEDSSS